MLCPHEPFPRKLTQYVRSKLMSFSGSCLDTLLLLISYAVPLYWYCFCATLFYFIILSFFTQFWRTAFYCSIILCLNIGWCLLKSLSFVCIFSCFRISSLQSFGLTYRNRLYQRAFASLNFAKLWFWRWFSVLNVLTMVTTYNINVCIIMYNNTQYDQYTFR